MTQYNVFGKFIRPVDPDVDECGNYIVKPIESSRIIYDGPNLPCTGVQTCNDLTVILQKLDEQICNLKQDLYNLTSTTSTTTTNIPL